MTKFSDEAADYSLEYRHATPEAWLFWDSDQREVWLPKSQVEVSPAEPRRGQVVTVTVPNWLAEDKGLA